MRALAWITAIFEEKKRNSRGDGENAESCGTEVRGKNRPANPLWRAFLKEQLHHLVNNFRASAPPRETNAEKTPLFSTEMKKAIKETHAEARRTRRVGGNIAR